MLFKISRYIFNRTDKLILHYLTRNFLLSLQCKLKQIYFFVHYSQQNTLLLELIQYHLIFVFRWSFIKNPDIFISVVNMHRRTIINCKYHYTLPNPLPPYNEKFSRVSYIMLHREKKHLSGSVFLENLIASKKPKQKTSRI